MYEGAIQDLIDRGLDVHPHIVRGWWKDTGKLEDMLEANRIVLESLETPRGANLTAAGQGSRIEGRVQLGEGVELIDSLVRGPVVIGDGTRLVNEAGVQHLDNPNYCIREGIIVVPKGATVPPGTVV